MLYGKSYSMYGIYTSGRGSVSAALIVISWEGSSAMDRTLLTPFLANSSSSEYSHEIEDEAAGCCWSLIDLSKESMKECHHSMVADVKPADEYFGKSAFRCLRSTFASLGVTRGGTPEGIDCICWHCVRIYVHVAITWGFQLQNVPWVCGHHGGSFLTVAPTHFVATSCVAYSNICQDPFETGKYIWGWEWLCMGSMCRLSQAFTSNMWFKTCVSLKPSLAALMPSRKSIHYRHSTSNDNIMS